MYIVYVSFIYESALHGMNISLAWNVYVYTALYVLVFLHSSVSIKANNVYVYNDNMHTYKTLMILFDRL